MLRVADCVSRLRLTRRTTADRTAMHRKSDRRRVCLCAVGLRKCAVSKSSRSEEHTSELQSQSNLVCRLLLEKKKNQYIAAVIANYFHPVNTPTALRLLYGAYSTSYIITGITRPVTASGLLALT